MKLMQLQAIYPDHIDFDMLLKEFLQTINVGVRMDDIQVAGSNKTIPVYELTERKVI